MYKKKINILKNNILQNWKLYLIENIIFNYIKYSLKILVNINKFIINKFINKILMLILKSIKIILLFIIIFGNNNLNNSNIMQLLNCIYIYILEFYKILYTSIYAIFINYYIIINQYYKENINLGYFWFEWLKKLSIKYKKYTFYNKKLDIRWIINLLYKNYDFKRYNYKKYGYKIFYKFIIKDRFFFNKNYNTYKDIYKHNINYLQYKNTFGFFNNITNLFLINPKNIDFLSFIKNYNNKWNNFQYIPKIMFDTLNVIKLSFKKRSKFYQQRKNEKKNKINTDLNIEWLLNNNHIKINKILKKNIRYNKERTIKLIDKLSFHERLLGNYKKWWKPKILKHKRRFWLNDINIYNDILKNYKRYNLVSTIKNLNFNNLKSKLNFFKDDLMNIRNIKYYLNINFLENNNKNILPNWFISQINSLNIDNITFNNYILKEFFDLRLQIKKKINQIYNINNLFYLNKINLNTIVKYNINNNVTIKKDKFLINNYFYIKLLNLKYNKIYKNQIKNFYLNKNKENINNWKLWRKNILLKNYNWNNLNLNYLYNKINIFGESINKIGRPSTLNKIGNKGIIAESLIYSIPNQYLFTYPENIGLENIKYKKLGYLNKVNKIFRQDTNFELYKEATSRTNNFQYEQSEKKINFRFFYLDWIGHILYFNYVFKTINIFINIIINKLINIFINIFTHIFFYKSINYKLGLFKFFYKYIHKLFLITKNIRFIFLINCIRNLNFNLNLELPYIIKLLKYYINLYNILINKYLLNIIKDRIIIYTIISDWFYNLKFYILYRYKGIFYIIYKIYNNSKNYWYITKKQKYNYKETIIWNTREKNRLFNKLPNRFGFIKFNLNNLNHVFETKVFQPNDADYLVNELFTNFLTLITRRDSLIISEGKLFENAVLIKPLLKNLNIKYLNFNNILNFIGITRWNVLKFYENFIEYRENLSLPYGFLKIKETKDIILRKKKIKNFNRNLNFVNTYYSKYNFSNYKNKLNKELQQLEIKNYYNNFNIINADGKTKLFTWIKEGRILIDDYYKNNMIFKLNKNRHELFIKLKRKPITFINMIHNYSYGFNYLIEDTALRIFSLKNLYKNEKLEDFREEFYSKRWRHRNYIEDFYKLPKNKIQTYFLNQKHNLNRKQNLTLVRPYDTKSYLKIKKNKIYEIYFKKLIKSNRLLKELNNKINFKKSLLFGDFTFDKYLSLEKQIKKDYITKILKNEKKKFKIREAILNNTIVNKYIKRKNDRIPFLDIKLNSIQLDYFGKGYFWISDLKLNTTINKFYEILTIILIWVLLITPIFYNIKIIRKFLLIGEFNLILNKNYNNKWNLIRGYNYSKYIKKNYNFFKNINFSVYKKFQNEKNWLNQQAYLNNFKIITNLNKIEKKYKNINIKLIKNINIIYLYKQYTKIYKQIYKFWYNLMIYNIYNYNVNNDRFITNIVYDNFKETKNLKKKYLINLRLNLLNWIQNKYYKILPKFWNKNFFRYYNIFNYKNIVQINLEQWWLTDLTSTFNSYEGNDFYNVYNRHLYLPGRYTKFLIKSNNYNPFFFNYKKYLKKNKKWQRYRIRIKKYKKLLKKRYKKRLYNKYNFKKYKRKIRFKWNNKRTKNSFKNIKKFFKKWKLNYKKINKIQNLNLENYSKNKKKKLWKNINTFVLENYISKFLYKNKRKKNKKYKTILSNKKIIRKQKFLKDIFYRLKKDNNINVTNKGIQNISEELNNYKNFYNYLSKDSLNYNNINTFINNITNEFVTSGEILINILEDLSNIKYDNIIHYEHIKNDFNFFDKTEKEKYTSIRKIKIGSTFKKYSNKYNLLKINYLEILNDFTESILSKNIFNYWTKYDIIKDLKLNNYRTKIYRIIFNKFESLSIKFDFLNLNINQKIKNFLKSELYLNIDNILINFDGIETSEDKLIKIRLYNIIENNLLKNIKSFIIFNNNELKYIEIFQRTFWRRLNLYNQLITLIITIFLLFNKYSNNKNTFLELRLNCLNFLNIFLKIYLPKIYSLYNFYLMKLPIYIIMTINTTTKFLKYKTNTNYKNIINFNNKFNNLFKKIYLNAKNDLLEKYKHKKVLIIQQLYHESFLKGDVSNIKYYGNFIKNILNNSLAESNRIIHYNYFNSYLSGYDFENFFKFRSGSYSLKGADNETLKETEDTSLIEENISNIFLKLNWEHIFNEYYGFYKQAALYTLKNVSLFKNKDINIYNYKINTLEYKYLNFIKKKKNYIWNVIDFNYNYGNKKIKIIKNIIKNYINIIFNYTPITYTSIDTTDIIENNNNYYQIINKKIKKKNNNLFINYKLYPKKIKNILKTSYFLTRFSRQYFKFNNKYFLENLKFTGNYYLNNFYYLNFLIDYITFKNLFIIDKTNYKIKNIKKITALLQKTEYLWNIKHYIENNNENIKYINKIIKQIKKTNYIKKEKKIKNIKQIINLLIEDYFFGNIKNILELNIEKKNWLSEGKIFKRINYLNNSGLTIPKKEIGKFQNILNRGVQFNLMNYDFEFLNPFGLSKNFNVLYKDIYNLFEVQKDIFNTFGDKTEKLDVNYYIDGIIFTPQNVNTRLTHLNDATNLDFTFSNIYPIDHTNIDKDDSIKRWNELNLKFDSNINKFINSNKKTKKKNLYKNIYIDLIKLFYFKIQNLKKSKIEEYAIKFSRKYYEYIISLIVKKNEIFNLCLNINKSSKEQGKIINNIYKHLLYSNYSNIANFYISNINEINNFNTKYYKYNKIINETYNNNRLFLISDTKNKYPKYDIFEFGPLSLTLGNPITESINSLISIADYFNTNIIDDLDNNSILYRTFKLNSIQYLNIFKYWDNNFDYFYNLLNNNINYIYNYVNIYKLYELNISKILNNYNINNIYEILYKFFEKFIYEKEIEKKNLYKELIKIIKLNTNYNIKINKKNMKKIKNKINYRLKNISNKFLHRPLIDNIMKTENELETTKYLEIFINKNIKGGDEYLNEINNTEEDKNLFKYINKVKGYKKINKNLKRLEDLKENEFNWMHNHNTEIFNKKSRINSYLIKWPKLIKVYDTINIWNYIFNSTYSFNNILYLINYKINKIKYKNKINKIYFTLIKKVNNMKNIKIIKIYLIFFYNLWKGNYKNYDLKKLNTSKILTSIDINYILKNIYNIKVKKKILKKNFKEENNSKLNIIKVINNNKGQIFNYFNIRKNFYKIRTKSTLISYFLEIFSKNSIYSWTYRLNLPFKFSRNNMKKRSMYRWLFNILFKYDIKHKYKKKNYRYISPTIKYPYKILLKNSYDKFTYLNKPSRFKDVINYKTLFNQYILNIYKKKINWRIIDKILNISIFNNLKIKFNLYKLNFITKKTGDIYKPKIFKHRTINKQLENRFDYDDSNLINNKLKNYINFKQDKNNNINKLKKKFIKKYNIQQNMNIFQTLKKKNKNINVKKYLSKIYTHYGNWDYKILNLNKYPKLNNNVKNYNIVITIRNLLKKNKIIQTLKLYYSFLKNNININKRIREWILIFFTKKKLNLQKKKLMKFEINKRYFQSTIQRNNNFIYNKSKLFRQPIISGKKSYISQYLKFYKDLIWMPASDKIAGWTLLLNYLGLNYNNNWNFKPILNPIYMNYDNSYFLPKGVGYVWLIKLLNKKMINLIEPVNLWKIKNKTKKKNLYKNIYINIKKNNYLKNINEIKYKNNDFINRKILLRKIIFKPIRDFNIFDIYTFNEKIGKILEYIYQMPEKNNWDNNIKEFRKLRIWNIKETVYNRLIINKVLSLLDYKGIKLGYFNFNDLKMINNINIYNLLKKKSKDPVLIYNLVNIWKKNDYKYWIDYNKDILIKKIINSLIININKYYNINIKLNIKKKKLDNIVDENLNIINLNLKYKDNYLKKKYNLLWKNIENNYKIIKLISNLEFINNKSNIKIINKNYIYNYNLSYRIFNNVAYTLDKYKIYTNMKKLLKYIKVNVKDSKNKIIKNNIMEKKNKLKNIIINVKNNNILNNINSEKLYLYYLNNINIKNYIKNIYNYEYSVITSLNNKNNLINNILNNNELYFLKRNIKNIYKDSYIIYYINYYNNLKNKLINIYTKNKIKKKIKKIKLLGYYKNYNIQNIINKKNFRSIKKFKTFKKIIRNNKILTFKNLTNFSKLFNIKGKELEFLLENKNVITKNIFNIKKEFFKFRNIKKYYKNKYGINKFMKLVTNKRINNIFGGKIVQLRDTARIQNYKLNIEKYNEYFEKTFDFENVNNDNLYYIDNKFLYKYKNREFSWLFDKEIFKNALNYPKLREYTYNKSQIFNINLLSTEWSYFIQPMYNIWDIHDYIYTKMEENISLNDGDSGFDAPIYNYLKLDTLPFYKSWKYYNIYDLNIVKDYKYNKEIFKNFYKFDVFFYNNFWPLNMELNWRFIKNYKIKDSNEIIVYNYKVKEWLKIKEIIKNILIAKNINIKEIDFVFNIIEKILNKNLSKKLMKIFNELKKLNKDYWLYNYLEDTPTVYNKNIIKKLNIYNFAAIEKLINIENKKYNINNDININNKDIFIKKIINIILTLNSNKFITKKDIKNIIIYFINSKEIFDFIKECKLVWSNNLIGGWGIWDYSTFNSFKNDRFYNKELNIYSDFIKWMNNSTNIKFYKIYFKNINNLKIILRNKLNLKNYLYLKTYEQLKKKIKNFKLLYNNLKEHNIEGNYIRQEIRRMLYKNNILYNNNNINLLLSKEITNKLYNILINKKKKINNYKFHEVNFYGNIKNNIKVNNYILNFNEIYTIFNNLDLLNKRFQYRPSFSSMIDQKSKYDFLKTNSKLKINLGNLNIINLDEIALNYKNIKYKQLKSNLNKLKKNNNPYNNYNLGNLINNLEIEYFKNISIREFIKNLRKIVLDENYIKDKKYYKSNRWINFDIIHQYTDGVKDDLRYYLDPIWKSTYNDLQEKTVNIELNHKYYDKQINMFKEMFDDYYLKGYDPFLKGTFDDLLGSNVITYKNLNIKRSNLKWLAYNNNYYETKMKNFINFDMLLFEPRINITTDLEKIKKIIQNYVISKNNIRVQLNDRINIYGYFYKFNINKYIDIIKELRIIQSFKQWLYEKLKFINNYTYTDLLKYNYIQGDEEYKNQELYNLMYKINENNLEILDKHYWSEDDNIRYKNIIRKGIIFEDDLKLQKEKKITKINSRDYQFIKDLRTLPKLIKNLIKEEIYNKNLQKKKNIHVNYYYKLELEWLKSILKNNLNLGKNYNSILVDDIKFQPWNEWIWKDLTIFNIQNIENKKNILINKIKYIIIYFIKYIKIYLMKFYK